MNKGLALTLLLLVVNQAGAEEPVETRMVVPDINTTTVKKSPIDQVGLTDEQFIYEINKRYKLSPLQIKQLRIIKLEREKAKTLPVYEVVTKSVIYPIRPQPGIKPTTIYVARGYPTALTIIDSRGNGWPIEKVHSIPGMGLNVSDLKLQKQKNLVVLSLDSKSPFIRSAIQIDILGSQTTIPVLIVSDNQTVDISPTFRVEGVSPTVRKKASVTGETTPTGNFISLQESNSFSGIYDKAYANVLTDLAPKKHAVKLKVASTTKEAQVISAWQLGSELWLRIPKQITLLSPLPGFDDKTEADGWVVYKVGLIEQIALVINGRPVYADIEGIINEQR